MHDDTPMPAPRTAAEVLAYERRLARRDRAAATRPVVATAPPAAPRAGRPRAVVSTMREAGGMVYVMECAGLFKIGWSTRPSERRQSVQTNQPHEVRLLGAVEGTKANEAEWHRRMAHRRVRGEWFRLTHAEVAMILGSDDLPWDPDPDAWD